MSKHYQLNPAEIKPSLISIDDVNNITIDISRSLKSGQNTDINKPFRIAGKTAITRRKPSAPLNLVCKLEPELFKGEALHFGKGKACLDTVKISEMTGWPCAEFDFVHANYPNVLQYTYSTVVANYVLNVLPKLQREITLGMISNLTRYDNGHAIISVRSAQETALKKLYQSAERFDDGIRTSIGTFQRGFTADELREEVIPFFKTVRSLKTPSGYEIVIASHRLQELN